MIRALIVSYTLPRFPGPGSPMRDFCLAREMARRHEVTFLLPAYSEKDRFMAQSLADFTQVRFFDPLPEQEWSLTRRLWYSANLRIPIDRALKRLRPEPFMVQALQGIMPSMRRALRQIDWQQFDLLQVEHSHLAAGIKDLNIPVPKVLDWHNVYSVVEERNLLNAAGVWNAAKVRQEVWRTRQSERRMARRFDCSVATSKEDAAAIQKLYADASVTVVPNGVDCQYFCNEAPETFEPRALVFTGTMDYEPNEEGVMYFAEKVLPFIRRQIQGVRFYVVGQRPSARVLTLAERYPGSVIVTGFVDDVRPYLQRAAACVVPLLNGGGTRLKILEALAMQKAVVSTSVGAEGLRLVHGEHILVADDPVTFSEAVLSILREPSLGRSFSSNGYALVKEEYDWKRVAVSLEGAWSESTGRVR